MAFALYSLSYIEPRIKLNPNFDTFNSLPDHQEFCNRFHFAITFHGCNIFIQPNMIMIPLVMTNNAVLPGVGNVWEGSGTYEAQP